MCVCVCVGGWVGGWVGLIINRDNLINQQSKFETNLMISKLKQYQNIESMRK